MGPTSSVIRSDTTTVWFAHLEVWKLGKAVKGVSSIHEEIVP